jgi:hypothetical protein
MTAVIAPSQDNGRPRLAVVLLLALPALVLIGIGFGVLGGVRGTDFAILALALLTGAIAFVPLILDVGRPYQWRQILLTFTALAFMGNFVVSVFTNYFFYDVVAQAEYVVSQDLIAIRPADIVNGQIAALIGLLSMLAGYAIPMGRVVRGGIWTPRRDWSYQTTLMMAALMIPLGWLVFLTSIFKVLPKRLGSGFLGAISTSTYVGLALLMLAYMRHRSRAAFWMMLLLIPPSMAFNFLTGSKTAFLSPPAIVAVAYIVVKRRIAIRWIVAAIALVVLTYPVAEFQRTVILHGNTRGAADALRKPGELVKHLSRFVASQELGSYLLEGIQATSQRADGLGILSVIVHDCPSRVPYQGGWTLGYIALSYVPRVVWADKPNMTTGKWVTANFGSGPDSNSLTAPTWIGELYFNFGWLGIVIGMLLMGALMRALHELLYRPDAPIPAQLMAIVVLFAFPQTLQQAVISAVNSVVYGAMPLVIAHWGVRLLGGTTPPAPAADRHRGVAIDATSGI